MAISRNSKFKEEFKAQARNYSLLGATDKQMAAFFGVTEQTLNNWKKSHPTFFESLKAGKEVADNEVEESLYKRAMGYSHTETKVFNNNGEIVTHDVTKHYPPDTTAMIFWLKNRKPEEWRDKREVEHSGEIEGNEQSDKELARKIAMVLTEATHTQH